MSAIKSDGVKVCSKAHGYEERVYDQPRNEGQPQPPKKAEVPAWDHYDEHAFRRITGLPLASAQ